MALRVARWPVAAVVALLIGSALPGAQGSAVAATAGETAAAERTAAVSALLASRAAAIRGHDRAAFVQTLDPLSPGFAAAQVAMFDNLAEVPLAAWAYDLDPRQALPATGDRFTRYDAPIWVPHVSLRYGLARVDRAPTAVPEVFTFVRRHGQWFVGADDDLAAQGHSSWRGLWDFGPVVAIRGASSLVLAHPEDVGYEAGIAADVDAAVPVVHAVWGTDWGRQTADVVAVLIPHTPAEMAALVAGLDLDRLAAAATADRVEPARQIALGQRVVINPATLSGLDPIAVRVVLTHEITHIATRTVTAVGAPDWLVEGFADYAGYLASGVPAATAAPELSADIRRGRIPGSLPANPDFAGDNPELSQAYEQSWLACVLIAERAGQDALVRFYRLVASGTATEDGALTTEVGVGLAQFVPLWQQYLVSVLG